MTENTNELREWSKRLMMFGVIGVIGVIGVALLASVLTGGPVDKQVEAQGGLDAIATPVGCDLVELNGVQFAVCEDGSQWTLEEIGSPLAETLEGNQ